MSTAMFSVQLPTTCDAPSIAGIQDGGHNSDLIRKRLYFWLYEGQQHKFKSYNYISDVQHRRVTILETVHVGVIDKSNEIIYIFQLVCVTATTF